MLDLKELFEKHNREFIKFERVENKLNQRADIHAFLLLDQLVPGSKDIVASAEHDKIWLAVEPDEIAEVATEEQIIDLIRCGVMYCRDYDSFCMFV